MINRTVLVGRLTKDVELRYTQSGTAAGSFTLAVSRPFKNAQGERESDFINCVIWRKSAENFSNFTHKGSLVAVEGRIQTRNYENQQGQRVYVTEVVVDNFSLLESRNAEQGSQNSTNNTNQGAFGNHQQATNQQQAPTSTQNTPASTSNAGFDGNQSIDISDNDLPF